jgi:ABC-type amino acid transport system permease subunit
MSATGMRVGGYMPFTWPQFWNALGDLAAWTFGLAGFPTWTLLLVAGVAVAWVALSPPRWLGACARLYTILILGIPLAAALFHPANTGFARYFLCSSVGMLLLASEWVARLFSGSPVARASGSAALAIILLFSLWQDRALAQIERGHPDKIVQLMREASPSGGRLALETDRLEATTKVAATRADYRLDLVRGCAQADFLVSSEPRRLADRGPLVHCGVTMDPIGFGWGTAITGDRWILYRAGPMRHLQLASR